MHMTEMAFAPADSGDRRQIISLLNHYYSDRHLVATDDRIARIVDGILDHPEHGFFHVARTNTIVVGLVCVHYNWSLEHFGKTAWIDDLFVRSDYRNSGVGSHLLLAAIDRARRAGSHAIDFEVDEHHEWAGLLAQQQGFERMTRTRWVLNLVRALHTGP
jgi:GNAT superfamily N-acetyltransferase